MTGKRLILWTAGGAVGGLMLRDVFRRLTERPTPMSESAAVDGLYPPVGASWREAAGLVTSVYGWRVHPVTGERKFHHGVDFGVPTGTPVRAVASGFAELARVGSLDAGNYIVLRHDDGTASRYLHLSRLTRWIANEVRVPGGAIIGYSGATGRVTGPHLHFEFRDGTGRAPFAGASIDPVSRGVLV